MTRKRELTLLVIRHAKSVANARKVLAGRIDPTPLTSEGVAEARALRDVLEDFGPERVISSPLLRCRQTLYEAGISDPLLDERLIEMDYGRWTGKKIKALSVTPGWQRIQRDARNFIFPDGEGFVGAEERIRRFLDELKAGQLAKVAIFTHGDIARILINLVLNRELNAFQQIQISTASHSKLTLIHETRKESARTVIHYINRKERSGEANRSERAEIPVNSSFKLGGN